MKIKIVLRNPIDYNKHLDYTIDVHDHQLGVDWSIALKKLLQSGKPIEKNFCFMGFPNTSRDLPYLCTQLNLAISQINQSFPNYQIEECFTPQTVLANDYPITGVNHALLNNLHNHFEVLQGTVSNLSNWYQQADYETKYAIRQLNNICHEMETLILSQRKLLTKPEWVRPSQITTFLTAERYDLTPQHREGFITNGYDRVLGGVYMHWTQIGKTLYEVFRDENAPKLTNTICEAITELQYYSGEFDVEWGKDVTFAGDSPWHTEEQIKFREWLVNNDRDPLDSNLSLGYLPIGQVELINSFGTNDPRTICNLLGDYLDIYRIEIDNVSQTYDYCWSDDNYKQQQIDQLKPGYDYHSRKLK